MAVRRSLSRLDDDARTPTKTDTPAPKPIGTQTDDVDSATHGASDDAHIRALNENTQAVRDQTEALRGSADGDGDGDDGDGGDDDGQGKDKGDDKNKTPWLKLTKSKSLPGRSLEYFKRQSLKTFTDAKKEGLSGLSKEAGKLYANGEAEAKVNGSGGLSSVAH